MVARLWAVATGPPAVALVSQLHSASERREAGRFGPCAAAGIRASISRSPCSHVFSQFPGYHDTKAWGGMESTHKEHQEIGFLTQG
jgi:hypothetical protein